MGNSSPEPNLKGLIQQLRSKGVAFQDSLLDDEIQKIETEGQFRFPSDLRAFLQTALPISYRRLADDGKPFDRTFPEWRKDGAAVIKRSNNQLLNGILLHVEHGDYWAKAWGQMPEDLSEAKVIVRKAFEAAPILVPIYSHRLIPSEPEAPGNPIFSISEVDVVHYARDITDYFRKEFLWEEVNVSPGNQNRIRFWDDLIERIL